MVMPLRGMGRAILVPGVPLHFTPGYSHFAAPRLTCRSSSTQREWSSLCTDQIDRGTKEHNTAITTALRTLSATAIQRERRQ